MNDRNPPSEQAPGSAVPVRGLGIATLLLEALALLMAIQPLRVFGVPTVAIVLVLMLAGCAVVLAALLRFRIAWYLIGLLNIGVILTGYFQWALAVLGVAFFLVWWYVLHVRRTILGVGAPGQRPNPASGPGEPSG